MINTIWEKGVAISAVVIMISLVFLPVLNSTAETVDDSEKLTAEITEYRADGSVVQNVIMLTSTMAQDLKTAILQTHNQEKRLKILRDYGLLPEEINSERWQSGMMQRANTVGLNTNDVYEITANSAKLGLFKLPFILNFFCKVNGVYILGGNARLGLPPLLGFLKFFGNSRIMTMDLVDMCWGAMGILETNGFLARHSLVMVPSFLIMAGFVGVHVHIPLVVNVYNGFSAMTFAAGLGPRNIKFNFASSLLTTIILGSVLSILLGQAQQTPEQ